jgi:hypothetical protein
LLSGLANGKITPFTMEFIPTAHQFLLRFAHDGFFAADMTNIGAFLLMTFVIVGIISLCVTLSLAAKNWFIDRRAFRGRKSNRFIDWVDGQAMILSMQRTGNYEDAMPELKLRLQVETGCGKSFCAELCSALSFSEILRIREGGRVPVRFNRGNPDEIDIARNRKTGAITIHSPKSTFRYANSAIH